MRVLELLAQDVQTLDQGQTGVDHGGELPREDDRSLTYTPFFCRNDA